MLYEITILLCFTVNIFFIVKFNTVASAIVWLLDNVSVVPLIAETVTVPLIPVPVTVCPTLIKAFAAAKVTEVLLLTAPLTVELVPALIYCT